MRCLRIFLSFLAIFCVSAWAMDTSSDLYTARVLVTSRSDDAKLAGFKDGLKQVYMKLAAIPEIKPYRALVQSLENAPDWVDRFQYQQSGDDTFMVIRYNPDLVKEALRDAELTFSEGPRPRLVAWVSLHVQGTPIVLTQQQLSPEALAVKKALMDAASRWGILLEIPKGDSEDKVAPPDIQGEVITPMQEANGRYNADGFIAVAVSGEAPAWRVTWRTLGDGVKAAGVADGDLPTVFNAALLGADAAWIHQPGRLEREGGDESDEDRPGAASNASEVTLMVSRVNNLEAYMRIDAYLNTLPGVAGVETEEMDMPQVTFRLTLKQPPEQWRAKWKAALASEQILALDSDIPSDPPPDTFYYHYVNQ